MSCIELQGATAYNINNLWVAVEKKLWQRNTILLKKRHSIASPNPLNSKFCHMRVNTEILPWHPFLFLPSNFILLFDYRRLKFSLCSSNQILHRNIMSNQSIRELCYSASNATDICVTVNRKQWCLLNHALWGLIQK